MKTARLALLIVAGAAVLTSGQILADQEFRRVPERDIPVCHCKSRGTGRNGTTTLSVLE